jgi:HNH endonuclease
VTVDLDSLLGQPGGVGGEVGWPGPLEPEACRRLSCDGAVTRVLVSRRPSGEEGLAARLRAAVALLPPVLGGAPTQPLEVGRTSRVVQAAQRTALAVRDGGCVFPGCTRPLAWCEAHHLRHWLHGGPTDLANLALLCRAHHRAVHEGGWRLARGPDGRLTATPPHRTNRPHRRRHPTAA